MTLGFPSPEFDAALAAVCHGAATEEEMRALNVLLRHDTSARDEYLMRVELHSRLASEPGVFDLPEARPRFTRAPICAPLPDARRRRQFQYGAVVLAASVTLLAGGWWGLRAWRQGERPGATRAAVAMLTRVVEARWVQGQEPPRVGSALSPGSLRLESGLAQVVFYSGARVVMEGPAELRLVSPGEAICPTGRLLAEVPRPARGFRLNTDQLSVVDLGTAFGVDATPGRTEVHVFSGKVELHPGTASKQPLGEGKAVVVQDTAPPRPMAASPAAFASMFAFQQRSLASEAFRYEQWQFANARLRQDPTLLVHLDFEHLSGTDWTLPNAADQNPSVPEATVVGCQRTEGRWREKQALEFQSVNDRVRLVVPGEFEALTLAAWVRVSGLERQFNSLFMSDAFEPGTIHWLIRRDGVLGLTVFGSEPGRFQILASPPVITPDALGVWLHLAAVLDGKARRAVHYVNGEPVSRHALRQGPPYRLGPVELGNWNAHGDPTRAPHLVRNLSGALDEFTLFSRALTDGEIRALHAAGQTQPHP
ncbi:MAG: FecR domain-containing protein [Verrucomicrobiales bacterium]|nr:FecR domain-containing protein [Verrucomicrobiales bacterium]